MSGITCDQVRTAALDPGTRAGDWARHPDAAAHVRQCASCQDWLEAFTAGEQAWAAGAADGFAAAVIARTAGVEAILRDLPGLADMDPGPGFTGRVLAATSRRPAPEGWRTRVSGAWWALVRRPRFAWEAAYVATVCWVLLFGNPVGAIDWSASNIGTVARERLGPPVKELRADLASWRAMLAPDPATAQGAAAGSQAQPAPPVVRAWQAATEWLHGVTASLADAFSTTWKHFVEWFDRVFGRPSSPSAEPPAADVRSDQ
jgi:hypothetical protein